ncbi:Aldo/keto reductase [Dichomitus squalens LYAD-421 SS1]|uniref:Aldo/keto reductase n=1 Tax=Dichomitus squalens (strain LYAD-421) TaxID=732165 RepID=R7SPM7_DICSQ|nr:Aldo/keto reductase [Dichomitus squalens LYAD-421 SS1]EJF56937.1 Aldo/keto reductase [Dichomitus squalens LYAD-421 SS1]
MPAAEFWAPPPEPKTKLGRHRLLSPTAGVHVSPICLGAMSIGDKWAQGAGMGAMDKESSFKLLDAFYEAGGNFIDTANNYQDETSEMFIGEWMESRGIRDQMVIATKYSTNSKRGRSDIKQQTHYVGNSMKSLHISVEESLKKLRTSYIDILYVHWYDYVTSIEEIMNGLHALVLAGKVLYLGASDTPSWVVASANRYARMSNRTPFSVYQGAWSVLERDFERDIIPMCRAEGMALAPWNVLAAGRIRTDAQEEERRKTGEKGRMMLSADWERTEEEKRVAKVLEEVAAEVGAPTIQAVAIAYVMQKTPFVFPIIGGRKVEHLYQNIAALDVALTDEHIRKIEAAAPFNKGNMYNLFGDGSDYGFFFKSGGNFDMWPTAPALRPAKQ